MKHPYVLELCKSVNGSELNNAGRFGHMSLEKAAETYADTLEIVAAATGAARDGKLANGDLAKTITTTNNVFGVDLAGPARNLFPVITPLANSLTRNVRPRAGNAFQYKQISSIAGSGYNHFGFVPEGGRAGRMQYSAIPQTIGYATIGEEDSVTDEAVSAAQGWEDLLSTATLRVLLKAKAKEEVALLAGNKSQQLGACNNPALSASGTGTLPNATYSVICVALTQMGYLNSSVTSGIATSQTVNGADGKTFTVNGGSSMKSGAVTQATTGTQNLNCTVAPVSGAVAYAWFVGTAGNEKLEAITTINSAVFSAPLTGGARQAASTITVDCSSDSKAFDGFLTATFTTNGTGLISRLSTGVAGAGTQLSSNGYGGITEIDAFLKDAWENHRVGFGVLYVSTQELKTITKLALTGSATSLLSYTSNASDSGQTAFEITAGGVVARYFNPYSVDGGAAIAIKLHPNLAPGTMMFMATTLPPWYASNETPTIAEIIVRRDWYVEDWARVTRQREMGTYAQEALAIYAPFATGIITNIAPTA